MRLGARRVGVRSLFLGAATCLVAAVSLLLLASQFSPHGVVYGSVHRCDFSPVVNDDACNSRRGYETVPGAKLQFVRADSNVVIVAVTDSMGNYSISLPPGHYVVPGYWDGGPREVTVIAGQRVEADYQVQRLPQ